MNLTDLKNVLKNEPAFRLRQAQQAVFVDLIDDWQKATVLPKNLRQILNEKCPLAIDAKIFESKNNASVKALITLADGLKVETVMLKHKDGRITICVSSQVGCALGCLFCATGQMGFKRNLEKWEIVEQVVFFSRFLKDKNEKINNLVFMGMGEPFLNYANVMAAIKIINDKQGLNIGARHISISTIGITEGIKKLADEKMQINLAISLHAPDDELRAKIIPTATNYSLENIIKQINFYIAKTKRKVMIEYLMIKDFNDARDQAQALANLLKAIKPPLYFVNLIAYNATGSFKASSEKQIRIFKHILESNGLIVSRRYGFGQDINAACGQLAS